MKKFFKYLLVGLIFCIIVMLVVVLDYYSLLPQKSYSNADFNIETYISQNDQDQDGIDDQTDILQSARSYIASNPQYKSKYYETGYPNDEYGVCTDVIAFALLGAGYDLMELVNDDVLANRDAYDIEVVDKNIDFRRVPNLKVYFDRHAIALSTDIYAIDQWQGGDIVIFPGHIAIVSDKRNKQGVSFIIHNGGRPVYEEDVLDRYEILGHYRLN